MTDDPRELAEKVLSSPDSNPLGRDCARALLDALAVVDAAREIDELHGADLQDHAWRSRWWAAHERLYNALDALAPTRSEVQS